MIEFGKTLREAREAKGLSISDIAKTTHMMARQIDALEHEDFSSFAAPIYGRGFVKLYCEAVGLDPKLMVAEFMDIFTGNREPTVRVREEPPPAEPFCADEAQPQVAVAPARPQPVIVQPTFDNPNPPEPAHAPPSPERGPSRYAAPTPLDESPQAGGAPFFWVWRPLVLLLLALSALGLAFIGVRALYRATRAPAPAIQGDATMAAPGKTAEKPKQAANSKPSNVPPRGKMTVDPLYID